MESLLPSLRNHPRHQDATAAVEDDTRAAAKATLPPRLLDAAAIDDGTCAPTLAKCALTALTISDVAIQAEAPIAASTDKVALTRTAESVARFSAIWLSTSTSNQSDDECSACRQRTRRHGD